MPGKSRLKYIQSLGHKKQRDAEGLFIAEGPKLAMELIREIPQRIVAVYALQSWVTGESATLAGIEVNVIEEYELAKISQLATPNQVLLLVKTPGAPGLFTTKGRITLALDTIQDPGNLGTIIRIADWFGISQLVCSPSTADAYSPKVVQSSMGSIARVHLHYTELEPWLAANKNVPCYGALLDGTPVQEIGKIEEGILLIGNESRGIDPVLTGTVDKRITIPRIGQAESLNAAVATGILLSHLCKG